MVQGCLRKKSVKKSANSAVCRPNLLGYQLIETGGHNFPYHSIDAELQRTVPPNTKRSRLYQNDKIPPSNLLILFIHSTSLPN